MTILSKFDEMTPTDFSGYLDRGAMAVAKDVFKHVAALRKLKPSMADGIGAPSMDGQAGLQNRVLSGDPAGVGLTQGFDGRVRAQVRSAVEPTDASKARAYAILRKHL